ncbi:hypothetical protein HPB49_010070 [Dermacentor silvarum]|uniref:Uncharacterized protein n=1 Tax=Dermacentor silvarum TaxID=543639 RepID=A0ACB8CWI3_DERSI|nr:hypothetical protein HPB49_010070 [Dermacentor silvarum]
MSRLLDVRPVHNLRDIERLTTLYGEIRSGVRSLEALGLSLSTYGAMLLTVLRKSISSELCLAYFRRKAASPEMREDELLGFLDFMRGEVESRERAQSALRQVHHDAAIKQKAPIHSGIRPQIPLAYVLTVTGGEEPFAFSDAEGHQQANCVALVLTNKKEVMSRERRCYKCAKKNHHAAEGRTARWHGMSVCGRPAQECSGEKVSRRLNLRAQEGRRSPFTPLEARGHLRKAGIIASNAGCETGATIPESASKHYRDPRSAETSCHHLTTARPASI